MCIGINPYGGDIEGHEGWGIEPFPPNCEGFGGCDGKTGL